MRRILRLTMVVMLMLCSAKAFAFEPADYRWNITPGYLLTFGENKVQGFDGSNLGGGWSLEASYRLNKKMEVGAYASYSVLERGYYYVGSGIRYKSLIQFMSTNIMATATYNHRTSRYVELSAGLGLGWMYAEKGADIKQSLLNQDNPCNTLVLMPRIGLKMRSHMRFYAGYKWQNKMNSYAFVSVGYTFGIKKF